MCGCEQHIHQYILFKNVGPRGAAKHIYIYSVVDPTNLGGPSNRPAVAVTSKLFKIYGTDDDLWIYHPGPKLEVA